MFNYMNKRKTEAKGQIIMMIFIIIVILIVVLYLSTRFRNWEACETHQQRGCCVTRTHESNQDNSEEDMIITYHEPKYKRGLDE